MHIVYRNQRFYTDRVDCDFHISFHEYGIVRNPKTSECVFCLNTLFHEKIEDGIVKADIISDNIDIDSVREALEEVDDGYFDYIGSTREAEIKSLDNDHLTLHIMNLMQYDGTFYYA